MSALIVFIQKAIAQGIGMLFGATGEIITEKSGNLNLGVPGLMYMGGIAGLMGAFIYESRESKRHCGGAYFHAVCLVGFRFWCINLQCSDHYIES